MNPALRASLVRLLPTENETLLLKALLIAGESGARAWAAFSDRHPDLTEEFRTDRGRRNRLAPLLLESLRQLGVEGPPRLMTTLRTAYVREELRASIYQRILGEVLEALGEAGVDVLVTRGAALGESVYTEPCHRHSHDIDLLVRPAQLATASAALQEMGLVPGRSPIRGQGVCWAHSTELPVLLLTRLFRYTPHAGEFEDVWDRREQAVLGGVDGFTLTGADHLVHILGHASYCPSRSSLVWAVDAWKLVSNTAGIDWERFGERVAEGRLTPSAAVMLRYLNDELEAPIPQKVLTDLLGSRVGVSKFERDLALHGARQSKSRFAPGSGPSRIFLRHRLTTLGWELFPGQEYLRWAHGGRTIGPVGLLYLTRPATALWSKGYWALQRRGLLSGGT